MTSAIVKDGRPSVIESRIDAPNALGRIAAAVGEAKPMVWLTGVEGIARLLSFGFYLIAARVFAPQDFGVVQYTITVALLAFAGLQVLVTAIIRELGVERVDAERTREVLGSSLAAAIGLFVVTSLLCVLAKAIGLAEGANTLGLLVVLAGTAAFQLYYAIGRGLGDQGRQAASYVGASFAQLLMFLALVAITRPTTAQALVIFGASSFVPVLLYEWRRPILRGLPLPISRDVLARLWLLGAPLLAAQVGYLLWNSLDQLWVHSALGAYDLGLYASAKNLSQALIVIPGGTTGVMLPRIAQLCRDGRTDSARRLVIWGTLGTIAASALVALAIVLVRVPLLSDLYGHTYRGAATALAAQALGMVCYAGFAALTMAAIGWGRPRVYLAGIAVAAVSEALCFQVLGCESLPAAGLVYAGSIAAALLFVVALLRVRPLWSAA